MQRSEAQEAPHSKKHPKPNNTMRDGRDVSVKLLKEVIKTNDIIGTEKLTDIMISLQKVNPDNIFKDSVEIIVNEVILNFKLTKAALMMNKPESRLARRFCYVLLQVKLNTDTPYISGYFKRDKKTVWGEIALFNALDKENRIDSQILARYETIKKNIDKKLSK